MSFDNSQWIPELDPTNPTGTDPKSLGDDELRALKVVLLNQFPAFTGEAVTLTEAEINALGSVSAVSGTNLIINGDFRVNQRGFDGSSWVNNVYGYDRWAGDAVGIRQIIPEINIGTGIYTLCWEGGGNGFIGATTGPSPLEHDFGTAPVSPVEIKLPVTSNNVQFNEGKCTIFQRRDYATEISLCQHYYFEDSLKTYLWFQPSPINNEVHCSKDYDHPVSMRIPPQVVVTADVPGSGSDGWVALPAVEVQNTERTRIKGERNSQNGNSFIDSVTFDAELYNP